MEWQRITPRHYKVETENFRFEMFESGLGTNERWTLYIGMEHSTTAHYEDFDNKEAAKSMALPRALEMVNTWRQEIQRAMREEHGLHPS